MDVCRRSCPKDYAGLGQFLNCLHISVVSALVLRTEALARCVAGVQGAVGHLLSLTSPFVEPCFHHEGIFKKARAEVDDLLRVLGFRPIFFGLSPLISSCAMS